MAIPDFQSLTLPFLKLAGDACLYDSVPCESEVEREFVKALDHRSDVKLYFKLPRWFRVETLVAGYNPDWATVMQSHNPDTAKEKVLYLGRETKGANR